MTKRSIKLFTLLTPVALLLGCGQMGPLYLPKEDTATVVKSVEPTNEAKTNSETVKTKSNNNNAKTVNKAVDVTGNTDKDRVSGQSKVTVSPANDQTIADDTQAEQDMQSIQNKQNQDSQKNRSE
ncbi:LPS translocon maturation chaperone LptM [Cysteiniphilum halobium]|uniref:LPS translocon maturation chaperone LptM n=1 Tax=Cysteiniphilum halobium TaxID=2219059 RepID=UPI003F82511D